MSATRTREDRYLRLLVERRTLLEDVRAFLLTDPSRGDYLERRARLVRRIDSALSVHTDHPTWEAWEQVERDYAEAKGRDG